LFPEDGAGETGWDVALWHNGTHSREWEQLDLNETHGVTEIVSIRFDPRIVLNNCTEKNEAQ
jgi:hypothetical protein